VLITELMESVTWTTDDLSTSSWACDDDIADYVISLTKTATTLSYYADVAMGGNITDFTHLLVRPSVYKMFIRHSARTQKYKLVKQQEKNDKLIVCDRRTDETIEYKCMYTRGTKTHIIRTDDQSNREKVASFCL